MKKTISTIFKWSLCSSIALPVLFAAFNGAYIGVTNSKSLELRLDPLVTQIIGPYDSLLWPMPLYFLIWMSGGIMGFAGAIYKVVVVKRNLSANSDF